MIDLHTHSDISDGSESPEAVVALAAATGITTLALTDHDTTDGVERAMAAGHTAGIRVIAGVEFSCHTARRSVHLLGYFSRPADALLQTRLRALRELRAQRNERLLIRLNERGLNISMDDVHHFGTGASVGRPHFAAALKAKGYVTSIDEAFRRFLDDRVAEESTKRGLPADEAIAWIREAGGVAVWAHPYTPKKFGGTDLQPDLDALVDAGLQGVECWYGAYEPKVRKRLARIAASRGLLATGGSDFHGSYKPHIAIGTGRGDLAVGSEIAEELVALMNNSEVL